MSISGGPTLAEVRRLEDEFADAMTRMYAVGNDLARLRARLATEASAQPQTAATDEATTIRPTARATARPVPGPVTPPPTPTPMPASPAPQVPLWQREGVVQRLLAVVGTAITLIGVAFLLALAIQMGVFGPPLRVLGGAMLAVGLVAAAEWVRRRQGTTAGSTGLAATGIAAAYLDVLAVTRLYEWVPPAGGLVLAGLIALAGVLLARAWHSQLLGCLSVLGVALLAPFVGGSHEMLTAAFLLVLTVASWPAGIGRDWPVLELARVVPTALHLAVVTTFTEELGVLTLMAVLLALLVTATGIGGNRVTALPEQLGVLASLATLPMAVAAFTFDDRLLTTGLLLAATCLLVLLAGLSRHAPATAWRLRQPEATLPVAGLLSLLAAGALGEGTDWFGPLVAAVVLAWALSALGLAHRTTVVVALGVTALALLGSLGLLPFVLLRSEAGWVLPTHLLTVLALVMTALVLTRAVEVLPPSGAMVLGRMAAGVAVLWAGGAVVLTGVLLGQPGGAAETGFIAGQAGATVLWLGIAAALLLHGLRGSSVALPAGLVLVALSVGKLLFFDLAFLDGLARVLSFIVGGLLLLAMGAGYAQALERTRRESPPVDKSGQLPPAAPTV